MCHGDIGIFLYSSNYDLNSWFIYPETRTPIGRSIPTRCFIIIIYENFIYLTVLREEFRLEPVSTQTAQGETVILECSPPRGNPEPSVYWKKNGQALHFDADSR